MVAGPVPQAGRLACHGEEDRRDIHGSPAYILQKGQVHGQNDEPAKITADKKWLPA